MQQEGLAIIMPPTVATLLPLEAVVQPFPSAVPQPYSLQQHAVCPGLLLVSVQWLVGSGGGVLGSLAASSSLRAAGISGGLAWCWRV